MNEGEFTLEQLLEELWSGEPDSGDDDSFHTNAEIVLATNRSRHAVSKALQQLAQDGKLDIRKVWRESALMAGQRYWAYGYRLKQLDIT